MIHIDGLGNFERDNRTDWLVGGPIYLGMMDRECTLVLDGYEADPNKSDFLSAIANLRELREESLNAVTSDLFRYYEYCNSLWEPGDEEYVDIPEPQDVWRHVKIGTRLVISRRGYGDKRIYVSIESECEWEPEHGLQIVLKEGLRICKLGPYDGHLTNSDAYARPELEDVIYHGA